ncbi:ATP-binding cassette domain-containing protein [Microbacterium sp.]|uniref:ATP-binding cassette domain-containing protein n=1 Tax=Microbacterium sp. TaxID=51671 RepID=UPI0025D41A42|nr:ATP-binding cassette domain-containing protein [Microbacterium sp.]
MIRLRARVSARDLDVDLSLEEGVTTAIAGPNGSGKSTVLAVFAGLLVPDEGELIVGDEVLMGARVWRESHRRGVVLMSQRVLLFPHLSVRENVAFGPRSHGRSRTESRAAADRWLDEVGMSAFAGRRSTELSGGQAQRVALARALAAEPRILLLDEPFAALDVAGVPPMRALLARELAGRTAVIVSHDTADVAALAVRAIGLRSGRVVSDTSIRTSTREDA